MMLKTARLKRHWKLCSIVGGIVVAFGVMFYMGFASDIGTAMLARLPSSAAVLSSEGDYYGPWTLEERIIRADVIARVKLGSIVQTTELFVNDDGDEYYVGALEFTFNALEYLKGSGSSQLTALAEDFDVFYETELGASTLGEDLLSVRDERWDDREAIVFLSKDDELPSTKQADRYWLGSLRFSGEEHYTIASRHYQMWLPDAVAASAASSTGEQRFLLDEPSEGVSVSAAASGQGDTNQALTITLPELKSLIAELDAEVAAGAGSTEYTQEEYRWCVFYKYENEREVLYTIDLDGEYYYKRTDIDLAASSPAGIGLYAVHFAREWLDTHGEEQPDIYDGIEDWIGGRDGGLFSAGYPGIVSTARPLPAGEYRFYYYQIPPQYAICDGMHEAEKKRHELFVSVPVPAGTLHEAFFDPVAIGTAVGTDGSNGALEPASFTVGGAASALQGIEWQDGAVVLTLSPYASLTGHALDFIALDGTAVLTLSANAATVDAAAGTLSWTVATQPWSVGDQLMLRIRESAETVTPTPTATATTPEPYGPPTVRCPSTGAQAGAVEGAGAETTGSSGVYIAASTGSTLAQGACSEVILTVVSGSDKHRQLDVALNATEHLAFDAGCAQRQKSWSGLSGSNLYQWRTPLYACSPGAGTLTSTLTYSDSGATAATDTDTVTVPTATPTSTPTQLHPHLRPWSLSTPTPAATRPHLRPWSLRLRPHRRRSPRRPTSTRPRIPTPVASSSGLDAAEAPSGAAWAKPNPATTSPSSIWPMAASCAWALRWEAATSPARLRTCGSRSVPPPSREPWSRESSATRSIPGATRWRRRAVNWL